MIVGYERWQHGTYHGAMVGREVRIYVLYCVQKIAMRCEGILRFQQFARSFSRLPAPLIRRPAWTWALSCAFLYELSPFRHSPYVLIFQTQRIPKYRSRTWVTIGERGRFVQWKRNLLFEFVDDMAWSTPNNALYTADFTCWCATNPENSILFGKATLPQMVNTQFLFSTSYPVNIWLRAADNRCIRSVVFSTTNDL